MLRLHVPVQLRPERLERDGPVHGASSHHPLRPISTIREKGIIILLACARARRVQSALTGARPDSLVDPPLPLRTLHVDAILRSKDIRRVLTALELPPDYDVAYLQGLEEVEDRLDLELTVRGQQLQFDALPQHPE